MTGTQTTAGPTWVLHTPDRTGRRLAITVLLTAGLAATMLGALYAFYEGGPAGLGLPFGGIAVVVALLALGGVPPHVPIPVRVEGPVLHIGDERWALEALGWATADDGNLVIYDVDGAILHDATYAEADSAEAIATLLRDQAPSHSAIEERREGAARLHHESRKLTEGR